jgi:radical SAM superfamily enzyme YgiQ (UPF0313 family)
MYYAQPVYRPLSEAQSLLIQATIGCSQPTCTFCLSSRQSIFSIRNIADIKADLDEAASLMGDQVESIFLLAGDAFVMRARDLCAISSHAYDTFPNLRRVSSYAIAKDILRKSADDLRAIRATGFGQLYVGVDSGSDEVLRRTNKGTDAQGIVDGCLKAIDCGFTLSVTVILGLGGAELTAQHAQDTARALSRINPHYLGIVTLMALPETAFGQSIKEGRVAALDEKGLVAELRVLVQGLEMDQRNCVVRSNHPSNYLTLAGTLPHDKATLLASAATEDAWSAPLRPRHPVLRTL